ncbi:4825_t:CDS:2 [Rhizophagus irregularis]|nr:4825_t:CDS:2 [Rhizophagus irregularis]
MVLQDTTDGLRHQQTASEKRWYHATQMVPTVTTDGSRHQQTGINGKRRWYHATKMVPTIMVLQDTTDGLR